MTPKLTVLSMGLGQDSTALLYQYAYNPKFRAKYAPRDFLVVFSDTGDEHKETYSHLRKIRAFCKKHKILFHAITADQGYHPPSWQSLQGFYDLHKAIGSKAYPKTCTDKLKIVPIYRWLEQHLGERYGVSVGRKKGFLEFAERHGKVRVLVGISKGEENRMADPAKETQKWRQKSIEVVYPLVDLGLDRKGCQDYIASVGHEIPLPSNCRRCPFMSKQELLWLHRFQPAVYRDWVRQEKVKLAANVHMGDRNLGVWGRKTLPQVLQEAQKLYGHWSDDQLWDYKRSHGHCVASKY